MDWFDSSQAVEEGGGPRAGPRLTPAAPVDVGIILDSPKSVILTSPLWNKMLPEHAKEREI